MQPVLGLLVGFGLVGASPVQRQARLIESASEHCVDNGCSTRFGGLGSCVDTSHELNLLSLSTRFDMSVTSLKGICGTTASGKEDCCHCMKKLSNSTQTTANYINGGNSNEGVSETTIAAGGDTTKDPDSMITTAGGNSDAQSTIGELSTAGGDFTTRRPGPSTGNPGASTTEGGDFTTGRPGASTTEGGDFTTGNPGASTGNPGASTTERPGA